MSFIRKIHKGGKVYLAEVENKWIGGKCIQKHIRYVEKEVDGKTVLASSISDIEVEAVKLYGSLLFKIPLPKFSAPFAFKKHGLHYPLPSH